MDFRFTETQRAICDDVREFAQSEIKPRAIELDRNEEHPTEILAELGERGYAGITLPEEYGGRGEGLDSIDAPRPNGWAERGRSLGERADTSTEV